MKVPDYGLVLDTLAALGRTCTATALCSRLEANGFEKAAAQLAIQRAVERGHIDVGPNWILTMSKVNPDYVGGDVKYDRWGRTVCSMPIPVNREEFLRENGWHETPRGWAKSGAFGKPLPVDSAYQLQTILDDLDREDDPPECECGRCLDCDARGFHADRREGLERAMNAEGDAA